MSASDSIIPLKKLSDVVSSGVPGANTNFLSADVTAPAECHRLSITISCSLASTFSVLVTSNQATALNLNAGIKLTANCLYTFVVGCRPNQTYNFQIDSGATVQEFLLEGVYGYI